MASNRKNLTFKDELLEILRGIIGFGEIKMAGSSKNYAKGDVMKYKNQNKWYLYKCKNPGSYSIPDKVNFKKIDLRS